jgi:exodeoxyribonuclease V alpha subunit
MKPTYQKYYKEETSWGAYSFITSDDIPECKKYVDYMGDSDIGELNESTIAGRMQQLYIGSDYLVKAKLEYNKNYQCYQYNPINIIAIVPKSIESQRAFLEAIVTPRQANILLEAYPNIIEDTINGRVDNIDLGKTKGIKEYTWNYIKERIINNYIISDILAMLQPLGVTYAMIRKLLMSYSNSALLKQDLIDNPYILTKIHGLGFRKVDGLALKINPDLKVSYKRTYAFIDFYLKDIGESKGHTWVTFNVLESSVRDNIIECEELYKEVLDIERKNPVKIYVDDDKQRISLKYYKDIETSIYGILKELDRYKDEWKLDVEKGIKEAENELGFKLSDEQRKIVEEAVKHNIVIISGKSGTGKTTISRALLKIYKNSNKIISASALSAKASQRITEATGFPASTIHRLLGAVGLNEFRYNHYNPLLHDVILADEGSMNNARIMYDLISAIKPGARLIISGDCKQLPPIGFGNVFSDLLELKDQFNVYELTKVHRQAEKSGILTDANMIREGINPIEQPELKIIHGELQDMYYMFRDSRDALNDIAINMYLKSIKTDGLDDVVIIVPRKKDCINSTSEINMKIQDKLISDKQPYFIKGVMKFKLGAKVIQRVNNYDKNVFNGEIGYIIEINKDKGYFIVEYSGKKISYSKSELGEINLAYALTVHLVQGSEYKVVIMIIDNTHYSLLDSCLLYTAVTRAKQRCLLLAEPSAFKRCIDRNFSISRQTWLKELTNDTINTNNHKTLIGEDDIEQNND